MTPRAAAAPISASPSPIKNRVFPRETEIRHRVQNQTGRGLWIVQVYFVDDNRFVSIEKGEASIKGRGGSHRASPASAREMIDVVLCPASSGTRRVFPP